MATRSKKITTVLIDHPILRKLVDGKQNPKPLSASTQASWDGFRVENRTSTMAQISALTGADLDDVLIVCQGIPDDELKAVSNGFREEESITFNSQLSDIQIMRLLPVFNALVSLKTQSLTCIKEMLECRNTEPVKVKSNALLAYMMYMLSSEDYICQNWQHVATIQNVFCSKNGKILNQKDFSKALSVWAKRFSYPVDDVGIYKLNTDIYNIVVGLKR